ncbi:hypothetical protein QUF74_16070 [Candidatus Halobeggiatoa sp. HSG11]|nr:hypothetical protein [Candidatus Halobeggiatoa sp. HSG11]
MKHFKFSLNSMIPSFAWITILGFILSAINPVMAAKFPIEKKQTNGGSQMWINVSATIYANRKMMLSFDYSNGNRDVSNMHTMAYIVLVDTQGNQLYAYKRERTIEPVSCFMFVCGKTVVKSEVINVDNLPANVSDVKFHLAAGGDGYSVMRTATGLDKALSNIGMTVLP